MNSDNMHAEVFEEKCTDIYDLIWNAAIKKMDWWMDRGLDGQICDNASIEHKNLDREYI